MWQTDTQNITTLLLAIPTISIHIIALLSALARRVKCISRHQRRHNIYTLQLEPCSSPVPTHTHTTHTPALFWESTPWPTAAACAWTSSKPLDSLPPRHTATQDHQSEHDRKPLSPVSVLLFCYCSVWEIVGASQPASSSNVSNTARVSREQKLQTTKRLLKKKATGGQWV